MSFLSLENLNLNFKTTEFRLKEINMSLQRKEFHTILGHSGSGKSTILNIIAGLTNPDKGRVILDDTDISNFRPRDRKIGMVFQQPLLFPAMNIIDNIAFGLKMRKFRKNERYNTSKEIMNQLGILNLAKAHPSELSGGQLQRAAIARALIIKPKLILMDEPFSSLDPNLRLEMRELVKNIHKEYGMTTIFVTHDRDEAFFLSDKLTILKNGEKLQEGEPNSIYYNPENIETADFIGHRNILKNSETITGLIKGCPQLSNTNDMHTIIIPSESFSLTEESEYDSNYIFFNAVIDKCTLRGGFLDIIVIYENIKLYLILKNEFNITISEKTIQRFKFPVNRIISLKK
jgi:ABC-type Fe3+/spermidine/putrescine transport system ATPase subunit